MPTVGQLLMELEEAAKAGDDRAGWERTSLKPYVEMFEKYVEGVMKESREVKKGVSRLFHLRRSFETKRFSFFRFIEAQSQSMEF